MTKSASLKLALLHFKKQTEANMKRQLPLGLPECKERFKVGDTVSHGAYGEVATLDMERYYYFSNRGSFIEVLAFPCPPKYKPGVVKVVFTSKTGFTVLEYSSVERAIQSVTDRKISGKQVYSGQSRPWFYQEPK